MEKREFKKYKKRHRLIERETGSVRSSNNVVLRAAGRAPSYGHSDKLTVEIIFRLEYT